MFSSLRTATLALILAVAAIAIISLPAQASDPAAGTWELNLAKSKFTNTPAPKSQTALPGCARASRFSVDWRVCIIIHTPRMRKRTSR